MKWYGNGKTPGNLSQNGRNELKRKTSFGMTRDAERKRFLLAHASLSTGEDVKVATLLPWAILVAETNR